ncbi:hypothetical protein [Bordetella sp. 15P40C-2]|uniref:hypothetical protein n=1 Tax=Bordetella sp. 15P40C-2 TaxID=2572246 RepID=UPI001323BBD3|nr:hypothetical protein [Bordetella sp. 15P40C-2]MVW72771.1 hypothetical protein [Bordetella sp. 15P40C-2]
MEWQDLMKIRFISTGYRFHDSKSYHEKSTGFWSFKLPKKRPSGKNFVWPWLLLRGFSYRIARHQSRDVKILGPRSRLPSRKRIIGLRKKRMISSFIRSSDQVTLVEQADFDPFAAWDEDDPGVELFLEAELEIDQFAAGANVAGDALARACAVLLSLSEVSTSDDEAFQRILLDLGPKTPPRSIVPMLEDLKRRVYAGMKLIPPVAL